MKKYLVLLLVILLIGTFAACGGSDTDTPPLPAPGSSGPLEPAEATTLPEELPESEVADFTIVTDLPAINLINHDLSGSDLLEAVTFRTLLGAEIASVTIISDHEELEHENAFIYVDAWAIELYYIARRHETAVESVIRAFEEDVEEEWFFPDSHLVVNDIRASADHQMALLVVTEELTNGEVLVLLYLAQNVPGSNDVVVLDILLHPQIWEEYDEEALRELSHHIGLDLRTYISEFLF